MGRKPREYDYIAHVCLNSRLEPIRDSEGKFIKNNPDYCNRGFVDIAPSQKTQAEQCWKYCEACEKKGYPKIHLPEKNPMRIEVMKSNRKNRNDLKLQGEVLKVS